MKTSPSPRPQRKRSAGKFVKVAPCLYRYSSNDTYYARIKRPGKELRQSLRTTDRELAKRRLADLHREVDRAGTQTERVTLAALCDRYLVTVQNQAAKTLKSKRRIAARIKTDWPGGADVPISKVLPSQVSSWLAGYRFGAASYNLYLEFIRAAFALAVDDRLVGDSPVGRFKTKKRPKPIRQTPTFDEFQAIVADIRAQVFNTDAQDSADFVEFIGLAGLGQAEASALKWSDVDWQREQFVSFRQKTSRGFSVPVYPLLRPFLERLREKRGGKPPGAELVLRTKDAKRAITGACKRLKLPAFTHRSFRRMFITRAIERGVDVKVIAEWQGHRDGGKSILDTYSHVRATHSDAMAKLM